MSPAVTYVVKCAAGALVGVVVAHAYENMREKRSGYTSNSRKFVRKFNKTTK